MMTAVVACAAISGPCRSGGSLPAPRRLTIVTYNIQGWNGVSDKVVDLLRSQGADIIFLQEVTQRPSPSRRVDHAQRIARQLDMHCVSASTLQVPTTQDCDVAILSRFSLSGGTVHAIGKGSRVFAVQATIDTDDGPLHVVCVHTQATFRLKAKHIAESIKTRMTQITRLLEIVEGLAGDAIIAGDFNAAPIMPEYEMISRRWTDFGSSDERTTPTFPSDRPFLRIDYVFGRGAYRSREYRVFASDLSDHLPVVTRVVKDGRAGHAGSHKPSHEESP
jgi:endonuclease/exonuclease/phosphatase family metal-dependent hydrolase